MVQNRKLEGRGKAILLVRAPRSNEGSFRGPDWPEESLYDDTWLCFFALALFNKNSDEKYHILKLFSEPLV